MKENLTTGSRELENVLGQNEPGRLSSDVFGRDEHGRPSRDVFGRIEHGRPPRYVFGRDEHGRPPRDVFGQIEPGRPPRDVFGRNEPGRPLRDVFGRIGHGRLFGDVFGQNEPGRPSRDVFGRNEPDRLFSAMGITVSPTGMIAIADYIADRIQVYSSATGQHQLSIEVTRRSISCPCNVAVSSDGSYYVTDATSFIKVYDSSGVFKDKWVAVSPDNKPSDAEDTALKGLAIDSKSQVLAGQCKRIRKYISIHKLDGSHVTSINVNVSPEYLAVTSQDTIIVSDHWNNVVQIVDITGQLLHILKPPFLWSPWGIYCYEDIILICNHLPPSHGVHCFSSSGDYLRCIDTSENPHCLAVWNSKLYVTYGNRVEIYSCK